MAKKKEKAVTVVTLSKEQKRDSKIPHKRLFEYSMCPLGADSDKFESWRSLGFVKIRKKYFGKFRRVINRQLGLRRCYYDFKEEPGKAEFKIVGFVFRLVSMAGATSHFSSRLSASSAADHIPGK